MSTGPTTAKGKAISSRNAIKHGLSAVHIVNNDEQKLYNEIHSGLSEEYDPQTMTEQLLVQRCALAYVRYQRTVQLENTAFELARTKSQLSTTMIDKLDLPIEAVRAYALNSEAGNYEFNDFETNNRLATYLTYYRESTAVLASKNYSLERKLAKEARLIYHCLDEIAIKHDMTFAQLFTSDEGILELVDSVLSLGEKPLSDKFISTTESPEYYSSISHDPVEEFFHALGKKLSAEAIALSIHPMINKVQQIQSQAALPDKATLDAIARHSTSTNNQFSKALAELRHVTEERRRRESLTVKA